MRFVRHLAWLNTAPRSPEGDQFIYQARREYIPAGGVPDMPPCDCGHMVAVLFDVGPAISGQPISHIEIESWQRNTGIELDSWESRLLRKLSQEYLGQLHESSDLQCKPPYQCEQSRVIVSMMRAKSQKAAIQKLAEI